MAGERIVIFGWSESVHVQRWVRGLCRRGFAVRLVSLGGPVLSECETIVLPRTSRWSYLSHVSSAVEAAREFKPDLVHGHYATGFGYWAVHSHIRPCVISVWGADIIDFPKSRLNRLLLRSVLRRATWITATSQFLRYAVRQLDRSLHDRSSIIPFGVALPERVAPPPPTPPVRLCYIKNLRPKYGPDVLLRSIAAARRETPDIRLTIAGEGEMKPQLIWETANLGLDDIVEFVGFMPNEKIYEFLQAHHIMVMPSVEPSESFGVAALEAAVCERPVIASWVGGVPEVVRREETGILVPPGEEDKLTEAIVRLVRDAATRERMGQKGRVFAAENYDWERSLDKMADLYCRLIRDAKKS